MASLRTMLCMCGVAVLAASQNATAQQKPAPVEERTITTVPLLMQQQRAGVAYRDLQQAAYEAKLAEQEVQSAQDAYSAARNHAEMRKDEFEKAVKAREAAREKEADARRRYDEALRPDAR